MCRCWGRRQTLPSEAKLGKRRQEASNRRESRAIVRSHVDYYYLGVAVENPLLADNDTVAGCCVRKDRITISKMPATPAREA